LIRVGDIRGVPGGMDSSIDTLCALAPAEHANLPGDDRPAAAR